MKEKISQMMNEYFAPKIKEYGSTTRGVDWNSTESQLLRFKQISKVFLGGGVEPDKRIKICDFGCGYGAYYDYLLEHNIEVDYLGIDICEDMITEAKKNHKGIRFMCDSVIHEEVDYTVSSGIFNIKQDIDYEEWTDYVIDTIEMINTASKKGFSFNCLTKYSDADRMLDHLYYGDPMKFFDYAKRNFSRNVALLHDYDLYEFTLLVKK